MFLPQTHLGFNLGTVGRTHDPSLILLQDFRLNAGEMIDRAAKIGSAVTFTRASTATYFDSAGVLQTAASGVARVGAHVFNGTNWINRGFLIEEARTNLVTDSEVFRAAISDWTNENTDVTDNAIAAPDGNTTADKLLETAVSASFLFWNYPITVTADTVYTWSIFLKAAERTVVMVIWSDGTLVNGAEVEVDLSAGTLSNGVATGTGGYTGSSIANVGNGWYRVSLSGTIAAGNTDGTPIIEIGAAGHVGDAAKGIYAWGAQVELGAFPTSYIPTTTAQVTRAEDLASMSLPGSFSATEGAAYVDWFTEVSDNPTTAQYTLFINDGAGDTNNSIFIFRNANENLVLLIKDGGVEQANFGFKTTHNTGRVQMIIAWKLNDFIAIDDGDAGITDTTGTVPTGLTTLTIGNRVSGGRNADGFLAGITLWNLRLPTGQLQDKTS